MQVNESQADTRTIWAHGQNNPIVKSAVNLPPFYTTTQYAIVKEG